MNEQAIYGGIILTLLVITYTTTFIKSWRDVIAVIFIIIAVIVLANMPGPAVG